MSPRGKHHKNSLCLPLICALLVVELNAGCDTQSGYVHERREFNQQDLMAIHRVEKSPIGQSSFLRTSVAKAVEGAGAEANDPIEPCDYTVQKIIERDGPKVDGRYFEHFAVFCVTRVGRAPELRFRWDLEPNQTGGVEKFEWGWASVD